MFFFNYEARRLFLLFFCVLISSHPVQKFNAKACIAFRVLQNVKCVGANIFSVAVVVVVVAILYFRSTKQTGRFVLYFSKYKLKGEVVRLSVRPSVCTLLAKCQRRTVRFLSET